MSEDKIWYSVKKYEKFNGSWGFIQTAELFIIFTVVQWKEAIRDDVYTGC